MAVHRRCSECLGVVLERSEGEPKVATKFVPKFASTGSFSIRRKDNTMDVIGMEISNNISDSIRQNFLVGFTKPASEFWVAKATVDKLQGQQPVLFADDAAEVSAASLLADYVYFKVYDAMTWADKCWWFIYDVMTTTSTYVSLVSLLLLEPLFPATPHLLRKACGIIAIFAWIISGKNHADRLYVTMKDDYVWDEKWSDQEKDNWWNAKRGSDAYIARRSYLQVVMLSMVVCPDSIFGAPIQFHTKQTDGKYIIFKGDADNSDQKGRNARRAWAKGYICKEMLIYEENYPVGCMHCVNHVSLFLFQLVGLISKSGMKDLLQQPAIWYISMLFQTLLLLRYLYNIIKVRQCGKVLRGLGGYSGTPGAEAPSDNWAKKFGLHEPYIS